MSNNYGLGSVVFGIVALCLFWMLDGDIRLIGYIPLAMQWISIFMQVKGDALVSDDVKRSKSE